MEEKNTQGEKSEKERGLSEKRVRRPERAKERQRKGRPRRMRSRAGKKES